jgi:hypothetical protein
MGKDWFDDEAKFVSRLGTGHRYAESVAARLRERGLRVEVTPMEVREHVDDRHQFADEIDLRVGNSRRRVDVKSRGLVFTGPHDYPHPTAFVDTVSGWERKAHKPCAIVLISQRTNGLAVIRRSTRSDWTREWAFDHDRQIRDLFFMVAIEKLATFDEFVAWLISHDAASMAA